MVSGARGRGKKVGCGPPSVDAAIVEVSVLSCASQAISQVQDQVVLGVTRMGIVSDSPKHETQLCLGQNTQCLHV